MVLSPSLQTKTQSKPLFSLPEDPVNPTPDVSYFLFICLASRPGYYVQHGYFFCENFGVHFNTIKTGTLTPEFSSFPHFFFKKSNSGGPGLNCVKMDPKTYKKKKPCCT